MESTYSSPFSKATLTAVFAGIMTTLACMAYDIYFRQSTGFFLSDIINVSSLIFSVNLIFLVIGLIYYAFLQIKKGELIYIVLFLLLTLLFAVKANKVHRSDVPQLNTEFHHLLLPIVITIGLVASLGIPFLFHNKKFEEHVL